MEESMLDGYSVRYPTLINPTKGDVIKLVLGVDTQADDYDPMIYEDLMESCVVEMFPYWWRDHVRQEQKRIGRDIRQHHVLMCEKCRKCIDIEIHHIISPIFRADIYGGNDPNNIQLLCHDCHKKTMNNEYRRQTEEALNKADPSGFSL